jgi:endonuclease YncB( thermonuclease family)
MNNFWKGLLIGVLIGFVIGGFAYSLRTETTTGFIAADTEDEILTVTKVIDGDTVIVEGGDSVRLLGIDSDERGEPCYGEAKDRLEELVLNKDVRLERDEEDKDQYGRYLRYIFLKDMNINLQVVKEGLAIARFYPENVKYKEEIVAAEKEAKDSEVGCKWKK